MSFLWTLSEMRTPLGEHFFQLITYLGQEMLPVVVICALYWCCNKKLATTIGFTYVISGIFVQGLKIAFRIPRPWVLDSDFSTGGKRHRCCYLDIPFPVVIRKVL